jgi:hypothetical protein
MEKRHKSQIVLTEKIKDTAMPHKYLEIISILKHL